MILDFNSFQINESSLKKLKKDVHGSLGMSARKRMKKELRNNIITFKFKKRNGDIRVAHGTLHPDYLPPLKGGAKPPLHQMVYYDLDKEGWRSFRTYSFIKILNIKAVPTSSVAIKPHTKSVSASTSDDEEETKTTPIENEEEQEVKKTHDEEVEKEEQEVKKPHKKEKEDEDEEEHEYKSPIYDETEEEKKERKEDDEKIEKIKKKDKDDKDKEGEDE